MLKVRNGWREPGWGRDRSGTITCRRPRRGSHTRLSAVRWGVAGRIVWAWALTIPASAILAMFMQAALLAFGIR